MFSTLALAAAAGYLAGSFPTGYLVGRGRGIDVRRFGSGATGGTNVLRTLGWGAAVLTAVIDVVKGSLASWLGLRWGGEWGFVVAALAAMVGHSYPVWIGWRGGKAVGTGAGAVAVLHPWAVVAGLVAGLAVILPTRYVSLGSLCGALGIGGYLFATGAPAEQVLGVGAVAIVFWRHRENISRLIAGKENKFGRKTQTRPDDRRMG